MGHGAMPGERSAGLSGKHRGDTGLQIKLNGIEPSEEPTSAGIGKKKALNTGAQL